MEGSIVYTVGQNIYVNLTNRCPCSCEFCIRQRGDGIGSADSLWLSGEPDAGDVLREIDRLGPEGANEIIFCGYGEPFCALDVMLECCREIRKKYPGKTVRVNTNGLGDLIRGCDTAPMLKGLVDVISISLNTSDPVKYLSMCKPEFGEQSFPAMQAFALRCKSYVPKVVFSVVDVIGQEDIARCQEIADGLGIALRVRHFE